ncbi:MAG: GMP synthase [Halieaceae bacterium]|jgi:GMP synthase-like glutamine amidotransferase|nr:GMP synthase [Halieaceae bacterium]
MRIGILKTDAVREELVDEFGEYPDMFEALLSPLAPEFSFVTYDVEQGEYPGDIDEVDAYLITGSKSSVYEDKPWIHRLAEFVRALHDRRKKLVGICFGHQMVAHALGGRTEKSDKGWGVGAHGARFDTLPVWHDGGDANFDVLVSHQDQVTAMAPGTQRLAGSDFCENAVCQLGEHILTFQGHPEFIKGYSERLLDIRRSVIGEQTYTEGKASLARDLDRERVGQWIVNFLRSGEAPVSSHP